ncbi:hypothetical protein NKG05_00585 [Oerskovia sp. M15]
MTRAGCARVLARREDARRGRRAQQRRRRARVGRRGFRLAQDQTSRALVGNELVAVLRRIGRDDEAREVAATVSRR